MPVHTAFSGPKGVTLAGEVAEEVSAAVGRLATTSARTQCTARISLLVLRVMTYRTE
jgi:hypothetical protein